MASDRSLLEREMQRLELRPFTLEGFHRQRERRQLNRRIRAGVVALVVAVAGGGVLVRSFSSGLVPASDPRSPFLGAWVTTDLDGSTPTMTVGASGNGAVEIVVRDERASVCSGAPSTMTGTGRLEGASELVVPSPVFTCDDGSEPEALSGPPLEEQLRNLTFVHDPESDALTDNLGLVWERMDGDPIPDVGPTPTPAPIAGVLRGAGEVLYFTGSDELPGDLVAVNPATGEERVLVEDLPVDVHNARWSPDGRWVAFEMPGSLWVVDRTLEPRQVFEADGPPPLPPTLWTWSSTGAQLAVIHGSTLSVVDPSTGQTTELASTVGHVTSPPAWSPDGTRIVFGARGGSVYSVDVRTGERSRVVQLPGEDLDSIDGIEWSPDGSRLVIYNDLDPGSGRLFVLNPDGSDIAVLADDALVFGFDWSPDGSRIAFTEDGAELRVFVAAADGSTRSLVASLPNDGGNPVWSPDGSQIALGSRNPLVLDDDSALVIDADGSGDAVPIDGLTYESWRGGCARCSSQWN